MSFGERAAQRRKSKDLKAELKQLKKELLSAGCEKSRINILMKEFGEALELGDTLQTTYDTSREHLEAGRQEIVSLLDSMGEKPEAEVQQELGELVRNLELVYHDCSIREDDQDYNSTLISLKQMIKERNGAGSTFRGNGASQMAAGTAGDMSAIMLRSELENIKAVLDDASGWKAPDFFALAYYYLHEDKNTLKEIENEQRNAQVLSYAKEHFLEYFMQECGKAGSAAKVHELMATYIYE